MKSDGSNRHHMADDRNRSSSIYYQRQTVLNLYNSGIPSDIIALQMDISKEEVDKIIKHINKKKRNKYPSDRH